MGIFVDHSIWSFEIQEHGTRRGMPTGAENYPYLIFHQKIPRAHNIVEARNLEVDVLNPWRVRREQSDTVVEFVKR